VNATIAAVLHGKILPALLKLALPTIMVMLVQTLVNVLEIYYLSHLGTQTLAGVALVFPLMLLMTTMSAGGVGGGVAAAISQAYGGNNPSAVKALVWHSVLIALIAGSGFTIGMLLFSTPLYQALGGIGKSLDIAVCYSGWLFAGAIPLWCFNLLSAALRGVGNVKVPALVMLTGSVLVAGLSPVLIFGYGPIKALGVAGAGLAMVFYNLYAASMLIGYCVFNKNSHLQLQFAPVRVTYFKKILKVGALSALGTLQGNITLLLVTGAVGQFGTKALAGYGIASRLDTILIPVMFGMGTSLLTMVGLNLGAGQSDRARKIMWTGSIFTALFIGLLGIGVSLQPDLWLNLFTDDPEVLHFGRLYLTIVGPSYGFFALGFILYFAAQGFGNVTGAFIAGALRLFVVFSTGILITQLHGAIPVLYTGVAVANVLMGCLNGWFSLRLKYRQ
jgi:putative MATE family efflux protein